jgi:hypothetical protein
MAMNVTLHSILGGSGSPEVSLFVTEFGRQSLPFDAGFCALTLMLLLMIAAMILLGARVGSTTRRAELEPA